MIGADTTIETINHRIINTQVGELGYAFLIDSNGEAIARPGLSAGDRRWDESFETESLLKSNNPELVKIAEEMTAGNTEISRCRFDDGQKQDKECKSDEFLSEPIEVDEKLLTEDILHGIKKTPVGQLLQKIAFMPEIRQDKVLRVRRELSGGSYNLNDRLDVAIDNILEELLI